MSQVRYIACQAFVHDLSCYCETKHQSALHAKRSRRISQSLAPCTPCTSWPLQALPNKFTGLYLFRMHTSHARTGASGARTRIAPFQPHALTATHGAPPCRAALRDSRAAAPASPYGSGTDNAPSPMQRIAAAGLAALLSASVGLSAPAPVQAVTSEQLLFLEAWRAVDRAYVDKDFNGQSWFRTREQYLKQVRLPLRFVRPAVAQHPSCRGQCCCFKFAEKLRSGYVPKLLPSHRRLTQMAVAWHPRRY